MTMNKSHGRSQYEGLKRVIRFNWQYYLAALVLNLAFATAAAVLELPPAVRLLLVAGVVLTTALSITSLAASHWVYDRSSLSAYLWLRQLSPSPERVVTAVAGYDETGGKLVSVYPNADISMVNFYKSLPIKEPSIIRAASQYPVAGRILSEELSGWPLQDGAADLVLVMFAAHEIRQKNDRDRFFAECARVVNSDGQVVLVEHLRDASNFVAYGPGAFHFLPKSEWLRCAKSSGLEISKEFKITPFVGVFVLCR